jgi:hypothetical protein
MLFFCVQTFDISAPILFHIEVNYPKIWKKVEQFQLGVMRNLKSYYEVGIEIGLFKKEMNPFLLYLDDQKFFELLSNQKVLSDHNITVLDAFNHHFSIKFKGILLN